MVESIETLKEEHLDRCAYLLSLRTLHQNRRCTKMRIVFLILVQTGPCTKT